MINIPYYRIDQPLFFPPPPEALVVVVTPDRKLFINSDEFDSSVFLDHYFHGEPWKISSLRYYKGRVLLIAEKAHKNPSRYHSALFYFTSPTSVSVTQAYLYQIEGEQLTTYSIQWGEIHKRKFDFENFGSYKKVYNFTWDGSEVKLTGEGTQPVPSEYLFKIQLGMIHDISYTVYWIRNLVAISQGRRLLRHCLRNRYEKFWGYNPIWVFPSTVVFDSFTFNVEVSDSWMSFHDKIAEDGKRYVLVPTFNAFNEHWREYYVATSQNYLTALYCVYLPQQNRWQIGQSLYYLSENLASIEEQTANPCDDSVVANCFCYYRKKENIGINLIENLLERKKFLLISSSSLDYTEFTDWMVNENWSKNYLLYILDKERRGRDILVMDKETDEWVYGTTTQEYGFRAVMLERRLKELDSKLSIQLELQPWIQVPDEIVEKIYQERNVKEFYCLKIFRSTDELNLLVSKIPGQTAKVEYETSCSHRILDLDEFPSVTAVEQFYYNESAFFNYPHLEGLDEEV